MNKTMQIARDVLAAVGGAKNVTANDICMTRLRLQTEDPSLVDTEQLSGTSGVLGIVKRGTNGVEVVFGPGKVDGVHDAIAGLTGLDSDAAGFSPDVPADADALKVTISGKAPQAAKDDDEDERGAIDLEDMRELMSILDAEEQQDDAPEAASEADEAEETEGARVLVINGPNINMLGIREPKIYGSQSYQALLQLCQEASKDAGFAECSCFQSNHEGDLVDAIQDAYGSYDGIVINPGAYTHTSIAILDAAKAVGLPMVEVHISKVDEREDFRQVSYIRSACFETVCGLGIEGYRKAIYDLAEKIGL